MPISFYCWLPITILVQLCCVHALQHTLYPSEQSFSRRRWAAAVVGTLVSPCLISGSPCLASEVISDSSSRSKPYAPLDALLPAMQLKILLEESTATANAWKNDPGNPELMDHLRRLVYVPQEPQSKGIPISMDQRYKNDKRELSERSATLRLGGQTIRSALNVYTANLRFGEAYTLTAEPALRKQLIRNDALPDVKQVIVADLDLRDLYRNQVQTYTEDLQAELYRDDPDIDEVMGIIKSINENFEKWLAMIAPKDVEEARRAAENSSTLPSLPVQQFRRYNLWS